MRSSDDESPDADDRRLPSADSAPRWLEDPELAAAVAEVEEFAAGAGWDAAPQLFALVRTHDLLATEPHLAPSLDGAGTFTAIAQDALPVDAGDSDAGLSAALARISWPAEVGGCVLAQEIVVLPPAAVTSAEAAQMTPDLAAAHPERREARLVAGVLRGRPGGACLLRVRDGDESPVRGGDLAPNLLAALQATFDDDHPF